MAKYAGMVGFSSQVETTPGIWTDTPTERQMKGDVIRASATSRSGDKMNDDISLNHRISLVGASVPTQEYYNIKYVELDGFKWDVTSIEVQRPRIIVTLGGMWNG